MRRDMLHVFTTVALASALSLGVFAQGQTPVFRAGVDLIAVDVQVVDKDGRPIAALRPQDFDVTISGKARRVASAEFIESTRLDGSTLDSAVTRVEGGPVGGPRPLHPVVGLGQALAGHVLLGPAGPERRLESELVPLHAVTIWELSATASASRHHDSSAGGVTILSWRRKESRRSLSRTARSTSGLAPGT